mgnify:CR=1 FL=1
MNSKLKNVLKITVILFILLLVNFSKVYALDEQMIEKYYEKIETEEGIFYKRKDLRQVNGSHIPMGLSGIDTGIYDMYLNLSEIIKEKVDILIKDYISKDYPEEQKIRDDYNITVNNIYSISKEKPYKDGDDIVAVFHVYAHPLDGTNNYWKENFSNNELYYDKYKDEYSVFVYYFIRLSKSPETGEYEISYIGMKPENFEQSIKQLEEKGFDLENLDVKKLLNISYADEMKPVASSNTVATSAVKTEYNSENIKEISNIASVVRATCIILSVILIARLVYKSKNK